MPGEIFYMSEFFLGLELAIQGLLVNLLLNLLKIGLLVGNFHIPQSFYFLLLQLVSILVDLQSLLVKSLSFCLAHFSSSLLLLLLLPPPDVRLQLLQPLPVATR
jgi:hypothetical protein